MQRSPSSNMEISAFGVADDSRESYQGLGRRLLNDLKSPSRNCDEIIRSANFSPQACTTFELVRRKLPDSRYGGHDQELLRRKHVPIEDAEWGYLLYAFIGAIYRELATALGKPSQKLEGYIAAVLDHLTQDLSVDKLETLDCVFEAIQDDADYDKPDEEMTEWQFAGGLCSAAWALKKFGNIVDSIVKDLWRACGGEGNGQVDWEHLKNWQGLFSEVYYEREDCPGSTEDLEWRPTSQLEMFCGILHKKADISSAPASAWASLNNTVSGKLGALYPMGAFCYAQYEGSLDTHVNLAQCAALQASQTITTYQAQFPQGYSYSTWPMCIAKSQSCNTQGLLPADLATPLVGNCRQGSVPNYYVDARSDSDIPN